MREVVCDLVLESPLHVFSSCLLVFIYLRLMKQWFRKIALDGFIAFQVVGNKFRSYEVLTHRQVYESQA